MLVVAASGCQTTPLGAPDRPPVPKDCVMLEIELGVVGDCLVEYLAETENYFDYVRVLRGEL